jgi:hypothetical protein
MASKPTKTSAAADGTVHCEIGYANAIQSHRIPDPVFRIIRHKRGVASVILNASSIF